MFFRKFIIKKIFCERLSLEKTKKINVHQASERFKFKTKYRSFIHSYTLLFVIYKVFWKRAQKHKFHFYSSVLLLEYFKIKFLARIIITHMYIWFKKDTLMVSLRPILILWYACVASFHIYGWRSTNIYEKVP